MGPGILPMVLTPSGGCKKTCSLQVVGTHPTGMLSCCWLNKCQLIHLSDTFRTNLRGHVSGGYVQKGWWYVQGVGGKSRGRGWICHAIYHFSPRQMAYSQFVLFTQRLNGSCRLFYQDKIE